jgi:hypothetical protein
MYDNRPLFATEKLEKFEILLGKCLEVGVRGRLESKWRAFLEAGFGSRRLVLEAGGWIKGCLEWSVFESGGCFWRLGRSNHLHFYPSSIFIALFYAFFKLAGIAGMFSTVSTKMVGQKTTSTKK